MLHAAVGNKVMLQDRNRIAIGDVVRVARHADRDTATVIDAVQGDDRLVRVSPPLFGETAYPRDMLVRAEPRHVAVGVTGNYRDADTTLMASRGVTKQGQPYLYITRRQIRAAADRCCYAGTDYPSISDVGGYSPWQPSQDDGMVCYQLLSA